MSEKKEQIINTIDELQKIVDLFYQQKNQEAFEKMDNALKDLENSINIIAMYQEEHADLVMDENKIYNTLKDAMDALEKGDVVLLADIFQYEFIEYLSGLSLNME